MHIVQPPVYIPSVEASAIYNHNHRSKSLHVKYVGMIPSSLELEALIRNGLKVITNNRGKRRSNDLINVEFKTKVRNSTDIVNTLNNKIADTQKQIAKLETMDLNKKRDRKRIEDKLIKKRDYINHLEQNIDLATHEEYEEIGLEKLRDVLYEYGFYIKYIDYNTGEILEEIEYVVYKRSTAKSRTGKVLYIRKSLYDSMIMWSRMGLEFRNGSEEDYVSLLAYESLVGSSISSMVKIKPENILVIEDAVSAFNLDVNIISKDEDSLVSKEGNTTIKQILWDGQSLLDESYYYDTKSMMLLRNHFFKSACFRSGVQRYLKDQAAELCFDFNTWKLSDMWGNVIFAKDVHMITTPSSLKFLKFADKIGTSAEMWDYWCDLIKSEGSLFGVVKGEKASRLGADEDGKPIQQMSYQYINSLPCTNEELGDLVKYELNYVMSLKNDLNAFLRYAEETSDITNSNQMMVSLYNHNPKFAGTSMFRKWKATEISDYVARVKMGKVKIRNADYAVLLGNPCEMLDAAIGKYKESQTELKGNEVYTKMFEPGEYICGFRSPHTSPANVLYAENTDSKKIREYFPDLSKNIVIVNSIGFPICQILSGSDFDSDSLLITNNPTLVKLARDCKDNYKVCYNTIGTDTKRYIVDNKNMAKIDSHLANSQLYIGQVTNVAQLLMSNAWDAVRTGKDSTQMWKQLECMTVLSGLCIDLAKRMPDLDVKLQISNAKKVENMMPYKPYWWMVRNKEAAKTGNKKVKEMKQNEKVSFSCPMDYLYNAFTGLDYAESNSETVEIKDLLLRAEAGKADNKQMHAIEDIINEYSNNIKHTHYRNVSNEEKKELLQQRNLLAEEAIASLSKRRINKNTMYALVNSILNSEVDNAKVRSLNLLFKTKNNDFIILFKKK